VVLNRSNHGETGPFYWLESFGGGDRSGLSDQLQMIRLMSDLTVVRLTSMRKGLPHQVATLKRIADPRTPTDQYV